MKNYFTYLDDLPPLPINYFEDIYYCIKNRPNLFPLKNFDNYLIFDGTDRLKSYTKTIFDFEHVTRVQVLKRNIPIHKDINRTIAYNFLIELGGDNVYTTFYDDNHKVIEKIKIEPQRWHKIDTTVNHGLENLTATRIALTIHKQLLD